MIGKQSSVFHRGCATTRCRQGRFLRGEWGCSSQLTLTSGDHPVDQLSAVLGQAVQFVYTCWDRIVLNGYLERLQRPEYLVHFFHDVVGVACIEPAVLEQRTNAYKA